MERGMVVHIWILLLGRLRQENCYEEGATLDNKTSTRPAWAT